MRGQCMVEFALAVVSMVLLAFGTIMIGRYQQVQFQAIVAARHATYQHAWTGERLGPDALEQRGRALFFTNAGWRDATGRRALIDPGTDTHVAATEGAAPEASSAMIEFLLQPLRLVSGFLGAGFDLSSRGLHTSVVRVDLSPVLQLPAPFNELRLNFEERSAVLGDAWSAAGPTQVVRRVSGLMPTGLFAQQRDLLLPLSAPIRLLEPAFARLCLGLVEPDRVPVDRLEGIRGQNPLTLQTECP